MANILREKNLFLTYSHNFLYFSWKFEQELHYGCSIKSPTFNLRNKEEEYSFLEVNVSEKEDMLYLYFHNPVLVKTEHFMIFMIDDDGAVMYASYEIPDYSGESSSWNLLKECDSFPERSNYPMTISCILINSNKCPSKEPFLVPDLLSNLNELSSDLKKVLLQDKYSDVVLKVGDYNIKAHKMILQARSPVFDKMFNNNSLESAKNEVAISDMGSATVNRLMNYLYTATAEKCGFKENMELYYAADKYEVLSLRDICRSELLDLLQVNNACSLFSLANRHCDEAMKQEIVEFISPNFKSVVLSENFGELDKDDMKLLMRLCASAMKD